MGVEERHDVVDLAVRHGCMVRDIHARIMSDAQDKLNATAGTVETPSETMAQIKECVSEESILKATIMSSFAVSRRISEWYGDDDGNLCMRAFWGGRDYGM